MNKINWWTLGSLASLAAGCAVFDDPLPLETESGGSTSLTSTSPTGGSTSSDSITTSSTSTDPDGGSTSTTSSTTATSTTDDTGTTTGGRPSCNEGPTPADELAFGPPVPLPGVNTATYEGSAWLSPNDLEVWIGYYDLPEGTGGWDIYRATRDDPAAAFGPAEPLAGVNTSANEEGAWLTADALTLYAASDGAASMGGRDIMVTTRASTLVEFGAFAPVANVNSSMQDQLPYLTADGSELYFATTRDGTYDIYRAELGVGGSFEAPQPVAGLSTPANDELAPVVSGDGLTIYFASGSDQFDIFVATRSTRDDGFGPALSVADVNSDVADVPVWLSSDGCRLLIASFRPGQGGQDLWIAEREL